jgi:shikimate kinase
MKVFLLGLPGSGKSTMGRRLAAGLALPFVDLDEEIEQETGQRVQQIFKEFGESHFRKEEARVLREWCASATDFVMATGGGTPCFHENLTIINQAGSSVFLDVPARIIVERILKTDLSSRPLFAGVHPENLKESIEFMRSQRMPFYRQAHLVVDHQVTSDEISRKLKKESRP